jgi:Do/DeqQ family serine protease
MLRKSLPIVALAILATFAWQRWRESPGLPSSLPTGASSTRFPGLAAMEEEYTQLVQNVVPSVVSITTETRIQQQVTMYADLFDVLFGPRQRVVEQKETGLGSGVIVSKEGHILTNHHVIAGKEKILAQLTDGRLAPAELIGSDPATDIAVLKIEGPVPALGFADSDSVRVGQPVLAVGNPFGLQETVTQGIISAKGRAVRDSGVEFLQTDAAVNQGNSGGPLLNFKGEVIGINSAIYSANTGAWLGISFAIPANVARHSMESILRTGRVQRHTLGVVTSPLTPALARQKGLRAVIGALVTQVRAGSPAEQAGIKPGDVIVRLNGEILETPNSLQRSLASLRAGTRVQLGVVRDGREYPPVQVDVADLPNP